LYWANLFLCGFVFAFANIAILTLIYTDKFQVLMIQNCMHFFIGIIVLSLYVPCLFVLEGEKNKEGAIRSIE
jgi:hypothetical protein